MFESKIRSSISGLVISLILFCFITSAIIILSRGPDFILVLISGLIHLAVLVSGIVLSSILAKKAEKSFRDFLAEAGLTPQDVASVSEFLTLVQEAFDSSPPTPLKPAALKGRAKDAALRLNEVIKEINSMDAAIKQALSHADAPMKVKSDGAALSLFINSLLDDLEALSKGGEAKGRYERRLRNTMDEIRSNYLKLTENRKAAEDTLDALKKNKPGLLPKGSPLSEELTRFMQNMTAIEAALTRLSGYDLEGVAGSSLKGFKSADIINNITSAYGDSLRDILLALNSANSRSESLANETRALNAAFTEEKRLVSQLKDSVKAVGTRPLREQSGASDASAKLEGVLQIAERLSLNAQNGLKSVNNISLYGKTITKEVEAGIKHLTKFRFNRGQSLSPVRPVIAAPAPAVRTEARKVVTGNPTLTQTVKPQGKATGPKPSSMLPRHYGKVPDSGYNFDSKDYGKYSR